MACRCRRPECDAAPMLPSMMARLDQLREAWGKPLSPSSGQRCEYWNAKCGGATESQHLLGNACDFYFSNPADTARLNILAESLGFPGIGLGNRLIHVDNRRGFARWSYKNV